MLLELFIIEKGSSFLLLRRSFTSHKFSVNGGLFSGLVGAISHFVQELDIGGIKFFDTGDHRILVFPHNNLLVVGIVEERQEADFVELALQKVAEGFWNQYQELLTEWNGNITPFSEFIPEVDQIVFTEFSSFYISQDFPKHMITEIRKSQHKFEPRVLRFIGQKTGIERGIPSKNLKVFKQQLSRELKAFSVISLADQDDDTLMISVEVCPICRGIKDPTFSCNFLEGFIEGYAIASLPEYIVQTKETKCIAHGDPSCQFELTRMETSV